MLTKFLFDQGHFHEADEDGFVLNKCLWKEIEHVDTKSKVSIDAVKSYQKMHLLVPDGFFGPICQSNRLVESKCRCGLPDIMERRAYLSEWGPACQKHLTTRHTIGTLKYSGKGTIDEAWDYAITRWNLVADVFLSRIQSGHARLVATANRESSGILAWSYLPNNNCDEVLKQSYNNRYSWKWQLLWTTICHEVGHFLGLSHGGWGIMKPANDSSIKALGTWEIGQVIKRYGNFKGVPDLPNYGTDVIL